ncbi:hypothetical protein LUZ61_016356 [Rhynchospora tenuis]|uniref:Ankyrin n=1 Tax=Rhynchospora tenuis TaxID=198213 RepID=A0AAD5Z5C6_9POAL|nr:hypothetical protein LUZ61_016356 [Rhynchospora tenuis]
MASRASDEKAKKLLEAASSGNLHAFIEVAKELDVKAIKDANGLSAFHLGSFHGRTNICQYFVEDLGFHVDFLSPNGETPLFRAAMGGHVVTARYLINHGANTVASDEEGLTPLHYAARYGQVPLLKFLLSLGVPVDVKVKHASGSPLIVAAIYGQESCMKVLLEHHADVNCAIINDCTPLFLSVSAGSLSPSFSSRRVLI